MNTYELITLFAPEIKEEDAKKIVKTHADELGMSVLEVDVWGLRTLAFPVKKNLQGRYLIFTIQPESTDKLDVLYNELKKNDSILRFRSVKQKEVA